MCCTNRIPGIGSWIRLHFEICLALDTMKTVTQHLMPAVLVLAAIPAFCAEHTPIPNITDATWPQYRAQYRQSPLCSKDEITLWSCESGKHIYSLCSSHSVTRTSGYMQYRASNGGKAVFTYPSKKKPPLGSFVYSSSPNGDASVEFSNNGYGYTLDDPLRSKSSIYISAPTPSEKETEISCSDNQTLQVNYTIKLMYDSGLWAGN